VLVYPFRLLPPLLLYEDGYYDVRTAPNTKLTISMFERSFFSDTRIGDIHVSLLDLTDKR
jgi:hypothetical protein